MSSVNQAMLLQLLHHFVNLLIPQVHQIHNFFDCLILSFIPNFTWLYRKNSYTEFFARAQFIKDFLSRIRYNFSKPGSVSDAKMLRIPLIFGITFFFWTIKGTACQISSFMYHFRPYSLFKVSSSSTL